MKLKIVILIIIMLSSVSAQVRVVIADFKNESDVFFLDSWERSVPDFLRSELSQSTEIVLLERQKMDAIFEEQKLALAGFIQDSALVQQIGNLVGADIILSGSIHKIGKQYRIDVNITRVKTTEVISEKVEAPRPELQKEMLNILANNLLFRLTGKGTYIREERIASYPTSYFLAGTAGLTIAAFLSQQQYVSNYDAYHQNSELDKFDSFYDKANNAKKLTILMGGLAGAALFGTIYCWIGNRTSGSIRAHQQRSIEITPNVSWNPGKEGRLYVQIHF